MDDAERMERDRAACALANNNTARPPEPYCEGTFDTWLCWPHTRANDTAFVSCPDFVTGFDIERKCTPSPYHLARQQAARCSPPSVRSDGAQALLGGRHMVSAPGDRPPLVQLHHMRQERGRRERYRGRVRGGVQRVAGRAAALARHPAVLQEPAVRTHHGAHEPVCVVRAQQRDVASVVQHGGERAAHDGCLARLVPRAQRRGDVRDAHHLHVDAVRGAVPAHGAGVRLRVGAAAGARAAGAGLGAAAGAGGDVHGAARTGRRPGVLDGRERAARRAGRASRGRCTAQSGLPVQHRARAVHQAARGRRRWGRGRAALRHGAARAAGHVPAGAAAGRAVPAHIVPADQDRRVVAPLRVRGRAHHLAAGAVRRRAVLLLQRRGAGAAAAALARADVPAARQLHHGHHGVVRAVWRAGRRRGQGVTGGGRGGRGRRGGRGARAAPRRLRAAHPLRARRQRRGRAARRAPALSAPPRPPRPAPPAPLPCPALPRIASRHRSRCMRRLDDLFLRM